MVLMKAENAVLKYFACKTPPHLRRIQEFNSLIKESRRFSQSWHATNVVNCNGACSTMNFVRENNRRMGGFPLFGDFPL